MLIQQSVLSATAVVGYDLLRDDAMNVSSSPRVIQASAMVGSAAINDTAVDLFVGNVKVATLYNTRAGVVAPLREDVVPLGNILVKPGDKISAIVTDAAATNPIILRLYVQPL